MLYLAIGFFIGGIYAVATGKVPALIVGGKGAYQIEKWAARMMGGLLILPLLITIVGHAFVNYLSNGVSSDYVFILDSLPLLVVAVSVFVLSRTVGRRIETSNDIEAAIAQRTRQALTNSILSLFVFLYPPLAFIYASRTLKMIDENKSIVEKYRAKANLARLIAGVFTVVTIFECGLMIYFMVQLSK